MFLKPANSDTEYGIKKIKTVTGKKIMYSGNAKPEKVKNLMYQNNTVIGWLPNYKIYLYTVFHFKSVPLP